MGVPPELDALCAGRGDKPILMGIDSNAHSSLWGYDVSDRRGEMVEEFLAKHNLVVINVGAEYTFIAKKGKAKSIIDITVASPEIAASIGFWRVSPDFQFSDHRRIEFGLNLAKLVAQKSWALRRADWTKFRQVTEFGSSRWDEPFFWTAEIINLQVKRLNIEICSALDKSCPKVSIGIVGDKKKVRWWSSELALLRRRVKKAEHAAADGNTSFGIFHTLRNEYKYQLRRAKRSEWQEFSSDLSNMTEMARFTKIVLKGKDRAIGLLKGPDGTFAKSPDQTLEILMENFFVGSVKNRQEDNPAYPHLSRHEIVTSVITPVKVMEALKSFGKFKAAGPDGLKPIVLQNLGSSTIQRLTRIFQACYSLGYVPRAWRKTKVIFIPKVGKKDYGEARSFRPISLSNFTHKTMERIVGWHLEETVLKTNPLSPNQHAFRKGKSTTTALGEAVDFIESGILRDKFVLAVFLDIEGAFDNLSIDKMIKSMKDRGFPADMVNWYAYYLKNRTASIEIANATSIRHLTRGTPQGGVLSPLAWNINFEALLDILKQKPAKGVGYADDGLVMVSGVDPGTLVNIIQPILDKAAQWGRENGLTFSPAKTVAVMFTRKYKWDTTERLKMNGETIEFSKNAKYLGLSLNSRLTWNDHVDDKIKKCKAKLMQIKAAVGIKWGPRPDLMLWAYKGIVVPALTYGSFVWGNQIAKTFEDKLSKLNRLALLGLGPMRPSTPTAGLEIIADLCPLDLVIMEEGFKAYIRCGNEIDTKWDGCGKRTNGFLKRWAEFQKKEAIRVEQEDICPPRFNWEKPFLWKESDPGYRSIDCILESGKASFARDLHFAKYTTVLENTVVAQGGCKIVGKYSPQSITTMNVLECCTGLTQLGVRMDNRIVRFIVPNLSPELGLFRVNSMTVSNCLDSLRQIENMTGHKPIFNSVKTFQASRPQVNKLVMDTERQKLETLQFRKSPAPRGTNSSFIANWRNTQWANRWKARGDCRQTKLWFPKPNKPFSGLLMKGSRIMIGLIIQFITGHGWLYRHKSLVDKDVEPACRLCGEYEETPEHLVSECIAIRTERQTVFQVEKPGLQSSGADLFPYAWTPEQLLRFLRVPQIHGLFDVQDGEEKTVHHS